MASILKPFATLWTPKQVKPTGVPKIDWSHPLANGLIFYGFDTGLGLVVDLARGRAMQTLGTPTQDASPWGVGFKSGGADTRYFNSDAEIRIDSGPFTAACGYDATADVPSASGNFMFARLLNNGTATPFDVWAVFLNPSSTAQIEWRFVTSGNTPIVTPTNTQTFNVFNTALATYDGSTAFTYFNGVSGGAGTSVPGPLKAATSSDPIVMGGGVASGAASNDYKGFVFYGAFWNRILTAAEILQLHIDPYAFLLPPEPEMPALSVTSVIPLTDTFGPNIYRVNMRTWR